MADGQFRLHAGTTWNCFRALDEIQPNDDSSSLWLTMICFDHAELQKQIKTPVCLDESVHSAEDALHAIENERLVASST